MFQDVGFWVQGLVRVEGVGFRVEVSLIGPIVGDFPLSPPASVLSGFGSASLRSRERLQFLPDIQPSSIP